MAFSDIGVQPDISTLFFLASVADDLELLRRLLTPASDVRDFGLEGLEARGGHGRDATEWRCCSKGAESGGSGDDVDTEDVVVGSAPENEAE